MRLTPLEIRKQDFTRSWRGFDEEEVQAFLKMVSEQWDAALDERRRLEERVRDLETRLDHYQKVEEALQEAVQTTRQGSQQRLEEAERQARILIEEAHAEAREIVQEARTEHRQLRREVQQLQGRQEEVVSWLRAFLSTELHLLRHFSDEDVPGLRALPEQLLELEADLGKSGAPSPSALHDVGPPTVEMIPPEGPEQAPLADAQEEDVSGTEVHASTQEESLRERDPVKPGEDLQTASEGEEAPDLAPGPATLREDDGAPPGEADMPGLDWDHIEEEMERLDARGAVLLEEGPLEQAAPERASGSVEAEWAFEDAPAAAPSSAEAEPPAEGAEAPSERAAPEETPPAPARHEGPEEPNVIPLYRSPSQARREAEESSRQEGAVRGYRPPRERFGPGWVVRPIIAAPSERREAAPQADASGRAEEPASGSSDETRKVRKVLKSLE